MKIRTVNRLISKNLTRLKIFVKKSPRFLKSAYQSLPFCFSKITKPRPEERVIYIDLNRSIFSRYLYSFLKMLRMEGYIIYIPRRILLIIDLLSDDFARLLLTESIVNVGLPKVDDSNYIFIPKEKLSPDYFRTNTDNQSIQPFIFIPMSQHPLMYSKGYWNAAIAESPRKNSLFMAGNFNYNSYCRIEKEAKFDVLSRVSILEQVNHLLLRVESFQALVQFSKQEYEDNKVILVDIQHFAVPMPKLREVMARFEFYFALPGTIMPFSHNVIEAMSVGSIPFIQDTYAELFKPPLRSGYHCITFNDSEDMEKQISRLFLMSDNQKTTIRQNIMAYYEKHLTPTAVRKLIENWNKEDIIYLMAERKSVNLLRFENYGNK